MDYRFIQILCKKIKEFSWKTSLFFPVGLILAQHLTNIASQKVAVFQKVQ